MRQVGWIRQRGTARVKRLLLALTAIVTVAGALASANIAQADSVWVQSYERSSQTEKCVAQPWETPWQASWGPDSSWKPSWEQWANGGSGGWTCTRSIVWARSEGVTYRLGDIGPGGGLVFLIADGLTYEMAPRAWGDPAVPWCNVGNSDVVGAIGRGVGTGSANTSAMLAACSSGAANSAASYRGGGYADWFLPSLDELNAMCNYSRNPSAPEPPLLNCQFSGPGQDADFSASNFGFAAAEYWTSSQIDATQAAERSMTDGTLGFSTKDLSNRVRPVRAF
jgi:hypothetical protein